MDKNIKKIYVTWNDFDFMINDLIEQIKKSMIEFDGVYGVPRGGLSIAVFVSHHLNLPLLLYPTKDSLVVDDISDTGITLKSHKNKKIACLYSSEWTEVVPDFFVKTKNDKNSWIIFPWEDRRLEGTA